MLLVRGPYRQVEAAAEDGERYRLGGGPDPRPVGRRDADAKPVAGDGRPARARSAAPRPCLYDPSRGLGTRVAVAVREVQEAAGDERRDAVGSDVAEAHGDERRAGGRRRARAHLGEAEKLEPLVEGVGVQPRESSSVVRWSIGSRAGPERRTSHRRRAQGVGAPDPFGRELERNSASFDARRRPVRLGHPPAGALGVERAGSMGS